MSAPRYTTDGLTAAQARALEAARTAELALRDVGPLTAGRDAAVRKAVKAGVRRSVVARELGLTPTRIGQIVRGK